MSDELNVSTLQPKEAPTSTASTGVLAATSTQASIPRDGSGETLDGQPTVTNDEAALLTQLPFPTAAFGASAGGLQPSQRNPARPGQ